MTWNSVVAKRDYQPVEARREEQLGRLQQTVRTVYEQVLFYQHELDSVGVRPEHIQSLEDVRKLPFTTRHDLLEHYPFGLLSVPREQLVRVHASSGTKGKPKIVGYTRDDIDVWAEVVARSLVCAGVRPGDVIHNAYGYGLFTGGLGLHYGAEYLGATVVPASSGNTQRQIMFLRDLQATALCCTPSYALTIAEMLPKLGLEPGELHLEYGVFGAEPWTGEMRAQVEKGLHITALDIYGLSEVIGPGVAMECLEGHRAAETTRGLHIFEDHFLPEIIDPDSGDVLAPGEQGELVFTTITKQGMPLLRYRTGDLCSLLPDACPCGRTLVRMSEIKGRVDDMLIIRGLNVYPSEIEHVLLALPELAPYYQIIIEREHTLDEATIHTEIAADFLAQLGDLPADSTVWSEHAGIRALQHRVSDILHSSLNLHLPVQVYAPGTLPRSEGKAVRVVDRRPH